MTKNLTFKHNTSHTVTIITAPVEIITLSSDSDTNDPIDQIEVVTIPSDSETDEDTTTEELVLDAVEVEERQAEDEWEWAAYSAYRLHQHFPSSALQRHNATETKGRGGGGATSTAGPAPATNTASPAPASPYSTPWE